MTDLSVTIQGGKGKDSKLTEVHVHPFETSTGLHQGFVVLSHPFVETEPSTKFFFNPDFGISMNQNIAFTGSPDRIHNGIDETLYTASAIAGTKFTFDQDDDRAYEAVVTVVNATNTAGDVLTLGIDGSDISITEGVDWNRTNGNENQTATDLATEIATNTGVSATASSAVVTIIADSGVNISKLDSDDATNLPASAQAVKTDNPAVNDVMQFAKGSDLTLANFTAITLRINVEKNWLAGDSIELYGYDTDLSAEAGNRVKLEDYFTFGAFDTWHTLVVPLSDLGIASSTVVDAFRIQIITKDGAQSPKWYLDKFQVEASGNPAVFTLNVDRGDRFHVEELTFTFSDDIDIQNNANASVPDLDPSAYLGVTLSTGFTITRKRKGKTLFTATIKNPTDHLASGAEISDVISDGTRTTLIMKAKFKRELILTGDPDDTITIQINDNMSGLTRFTCSARGGLERP